MKKLILLALLAAPVPAAAADLSTLGCVSDKLTLIAKAQVEVDTERNLRETGKKPTYDDVLNEALKVTTEACAKENGWPVAALQPAALYTRAKLGWPVTQRVATELGFDPAILEAVWLTLPDEVRNKPLTIESYRQLADTAIPEGEQRTAKNGEFISEFFSTLSLIQHCSYEFARAGEPDPVIESEPPAGDSAPKADEAESETAPAATDDLQPEATPDDAAAEDTGSASGDGEP